MNSRQFSSSARDFVESRDREVEHLCMVESGRHLSAAGPVTDIITCHCKNVRISTDTCSLWRVFHRTGSVCTFVSVKRRNNEASLCRRFTDTNVGLYGLWNRFR